MNTSNKSQTFIERFESYKLSFNLAWVALIASYGLVSNPVIAALIATTVWILIVLCAMAVGLVALAAIYVAIKGDDNNITDLQQLKAGLLKGSKVRRWTSAVGVPIASLVAFIFSSWVAPAVVYFITTLIYWCSVAALHHLLKDVEVAAKDE